MTTKTAEKIMQMQKDQKEMRNKLAKSITSIIVDDESGVADRIPPTILMLLVVDVSMELLEIACNSELEDSSEDKTEEFYMMLVDKILESVEHHMPFSLRSVNAGDKETLSKIDAVIENENNKDESSKGSIH